VICHTDEDELALAEADWLKRLISAGQIVVSGALTYLANVVININVLEL